MTHRDYDPHDAEAAERFVERATLVANTPIRYALVHGKPGAVAAYLPDNYRVIHANNQPRPVVVIEGRDVAGWTLDAYVIPRLGSGLYHAEEIDLSHPIMREVPS